MLLHHGDGFLIEQGAMLYCVQASTDGGFHAFRPVTMPSDATAELVRLGNRCLQLVRCPGMPTSEPSVITPPVTSNLMTSACILINSRTARLASSGPLMSPSRCVHFGPIVAVAVATWHTQGVAGCIEPWAWHQAVFDGLA